MTKRSRGGGDQTRPLPSSNQEEALARIVRNQVQAEFSFTRSSPIPSPQELAQYNGLVPNAAERIFAQWESQVAHRQGLESKVIDADIKSSARGLTLGFVVEIASLVVAGGVTIQGYELAGGIIGASGVLSLSGTTIFVTLRRSRERKQRLDALRQKQ